MKKVNYLLFFIFIFICSSSSGEPFSDQALGQDPKLTSLVLNHDRYEEVENYLKSLINFENPELGSLPSIAFQVKTKYDSFYRFYGFRDIAKRKPTNEKTLFRLASMTKPVTSVSALILYERGHFYLNQPLYHFLPDYQKEKMRVIELVSPTKTFIVTNSITTESGSELVTIRALAHGLYLNDRIGIKCDHKVAGLNLDGIFTVTSVPTIDSFKITVEDKATQSETLGEVSLQLTCLLIQTLWFWMFSS